MDEWNDCIVMELCHRTERERERERERTFQVQILTISGFVSEVSVANTSQHSSFKLPLSSPSTFSKIEASC
jgi:hypothetical protein